jgi:class 3 adenylate cyclase
VTLLFTDIEGSTELLQELGNVYGDVLAEHHRLLGAVWAAHGGAEVDTEGDAFFVAFASVSAAVAAATGAQHALAGHAWPHGRPVRVRIALHTGEPQQHDGTYWGIDVRYAARLCSAAHGGQVLLSAATRALVPDADVEDLGEHALKDFTAPRTLFHLVVAGGAALSSPPPRRSESTRTNLPSIATPLLGREAELADLARRLTETPERPGRRHPRAGQQSDHACPHAHAGRPRARRSCGRGRGARTGGGHPRSAGARSARGNDRLRGRGGGELGRG